MTDHITVQAPADEEVLLRLGASYVEEQYNEAGHIVSYLVRPKIDMSRYKDMLKTVLDERERATHDEARAERNRLLAATDWTQLPDAPEGAAARWKDYRQKLRDIDFTKPTIKWPKEPT